MAYFGWILETAVHFGVIWQLLKVYVKYIELISYLNITLFYTMHKNWEDEFDFENDTAHHIAKKNNDKKKNKNTNNY